MIPRRKKRAKHQGPDPFPLLCKSAGLGVPVKEFMFHPVRKWRVDYFFPRLGLAVEVEGGIWQYGRHNRASSFIKDMEKYNALALAGIHLMRFQPKQMPSEAIVDIVDFATQQWKRGYHAE
jgi:very-short-patch-repair endonuclease